MQEPIYYANPLDSQFFPNEKSHTLEKNFLRD